MARPPKIPNLLRPDQETIYFLTLCVQDRLSVLANDNAWKACQETLQTLDRWFVHALILMPDHIHVLASPYDREASINDFSRWLKVGIRKNLQAAWTWQEGSFDRLLRNDESAAQKWEYMRHNPVRAGLIENTTAWPYQIGLKAL